MQLMPAEEQYLLVQINTNECRKQNSDDEVGPKYIGTFKKGYALKLS
jgi:hypothetical protein